MDDIMGVDISKGTLDVYDLAAKEHRQFSNDRSGLKKLAKWVKARLPCIIMFESTGAYHRGSEQALGHADIQYVKVNPSLSRRFAQACGRLAKTDRVDCEMLAKMGAALELSPTPITPPILHDLRELLSARRALVKDGSATRARKETALNALLIRQLSRRIRQIEADIKKIDAEMLGIVEADPSMQSRVDVLSSIPGVGQLTALIILIDMPEIGSLDRKQVACLAGLAPQSQSSGKWTGKARIQGGRRTLRQAIFMPALVAIRYNPDLKAKYEQLLAAGKEKKLAITAVMRKLLILANALLRDGRKWTEKPA